MIQLMLDYISPFWFEVFIVSHLLTW